MNKHKALRLFATAGLLGIAFAAIVGASPNQMMRPDGPAGRGAQARRIELLQVGMKDPAFGTVVWDASGALVPQNQVIEHSWRPNDVTPEGYVERYRHIVFRVEALPGDQEPETCVGSPTSSSATMPEFTSMGFASSDYLTTRDGWHYFVDHLSVSPFPKQTMGDDSSHKMHVLQSTPPPTKDFGLGTFGTTNVGISATFSKPKDVGSVPNDLAVGKFTMKPGDKMPLGFTKPKSWKEWTEVRFEMPISENFEYFKAITKDGKTLSDDRVQGSYEGEVSADRKTIKREYLIGAPMNQIEDLRANVRVGYSSDLLNIPLSPKVDPKA